jgi:hypothetical protein
MCSILQKNFGWPTTGTHRCIGCDKTVDCNPTNSAACESCHPQYHKRCCSFCSNILIFEWGSRASQDNLSYHEKQLELDIALIMSQLHDKYSREIVIQVYNEMKGDIVDTLQHFLPI